MAVIEIIGQVTTNGLVNLRQGAPSTGAPVVRKLAPRTVVSVRGLVTGQSIQGNAHWYLTDGQAYVWAGGCSPLAVTPPAVPALQTLNVIDLSHGDAVTSFAQARAAGVLGVIHKATTGASGRDDAYSRRRPLAEQAGLLWGAYHWGTAAPIDEQVKNFLGWANPGPNTLVALDFETTVDNQMTLEGAKAFLQGISDALGRKAVLYGGSLLKSALGDSKDAFLGGHRLWLAQYGNHPVVQASWDRFWLWQYSDGQYGPDPKQVPGVPGDSNGRVDCDTYLGSADQLAAEWAS